MWPAKPNYVLGRHDERVQPGDIKDGWWGDGVMGWWWETWMIWDYQHPCMLCYMICGGYKRDRFNWKLQCSTYNKQLWAQSMTGTKPFKCTLLNWTGNVRKKKRVHLAWSMLASVAKRLGQNDFFSLYDPPGSGCSMDRCICSFQGYPIGSMYGLFTYIRWKNGHIHSGNVGI